MIFNDYDFKDDLIVEEIVRSVMPNVLNSSIYIPGLNGSVFNHSAFGETYITVKCRLIKKKRNDVQESMRKIAGKLHSPTPSKLKLRDEKDHYNFAIVDGMTEVEKYFSTGYFEIMFICHDPFAYTDEKVFNVNETFNNVGTFETHSIIEITAGITDKLVVHVGKLSEAITLIYPFTGTQKIVVDSEKQLVTMNGNNAMKYLSLESDFFMIPPGEVTVTANGVGTVKLKARYL